MGTVLVADLLTSGYTVAALDLSERNPWHGQTSAEQSAAQTRREAATRVTAQTTGKATEQSAAHATTQATGGTAEALAVIKRGMAEGRLSYRGCSVTDGADVARALDEIAATMPPIRGLVNAAGVLQTGSVLDTTEAQWQRVMAVNATGVFLVSRETLRVMVAQCAHDPANQRCLVTISSNSAVVPRAHMAAYAASKAAATHFTTSLGLEAARYGIRANVVAPGSTTTPMLAEMWGGADRRAQVVAGDPEVFKTGIPLGRIGRPEDVSGTVQFLLGDSARHMTMQVLTVDGGAAQR